MKKQDQHSGEFVNLLHSYVIDLKKPYIDHFERAAIIRTLLKEKGWSVRQASSEFGIPNATLQDWLLYDQITEKEYSDLLSKGHTAKSIYRGLREKRFSRVSPSDIDLYLMEIKKGVRERRANPIVTPKTRFLVDEAIEELTQLGVQVNLKLKKDR